MGSMENGIKGTKKNPKCDIHVQVRVGRRGGIGLSQFWGPDFIKESTQEKKMVDHSPVFFLFPPPDLPGEASTPLYM